MTSLPSYGKIYALGKPDVRDIFTAPVVAEEKVDGSQLSFGKLNGEIRICSRNRDVNIENPEKGWHLAVESVMSFADKLEEGYVWRGEFLRAPRHNVLNYEAVPPGNIAVFEIMTPDFNFLTWEEKALSAAAVGLTVVPKVFEGMIETQEQVDELMDRMSYLGGQKIEGLVFKRYFPDVMFGKFVSEGFKETMGAKKGKRKVVGSSIQLELAEKYCTQARWEKAIFRLRDDGRLKNGPEDIGPLIGEVAKDMHEECAAEIKEDLFKHFWKMIAREATKDLATWYKTRLSKQQFENNE